MKRALFGLFQGAVGKDVVSRAWRKVKVDRNAWCGRSLAGEDIVRLILDATVIRTRLDRKAMNISVLAAIGVRRDGQKILIRHMGGEEHRGLGPNREIAQVGDVAAYCGDEVVLAALGVNPGGKVGHGSGRML